MEEKKNYAIVAAMFVVGGQYRLVYNAINFFGVSKITHNFWCLKDLETDQIIAQLHGMATDSNGNIIPIGYWPNHRIQAYLNVSKEQLELAHIWEEDYGVFSTSINLPIHGLHTIYQGDDALVRWEEGVAVVPAINQLNLRYPLCGVGYHNPDAANSNAIYSAFAKFFGVEPYTFPDTQPLGINIDIYDRIKLKLLTKNSSVVVQNLPASSLTLQHH